MSPIWKDVKELVTLSDALLEKRRRARPRELYHYTSLQGLLGILSKGALWVSDIAYLNDASEMQLARSLIERRFEAFRSNASATSIELLRRVGFESPADAKSGFYVACFCEEGDLLSQWRAYGGGVGGGFAIGFNAFAFGRTGRAVVRPIVYDPESQRQLVDETISSACTLLDQMAASWQVEDLLPKFAGFVFDHLHDFLFTFKHHTFAEEKEWRVVLDFTRDTQVKDLEFRSSGGLLVPYMSSDLDACAPALPILPIVKVVHGPTPRPALTTKSLLLLLERHGFDHVEVLGSEAPLRV